MTLNEEQQAAFDTILTGQSVFLTGPGGVGKSYLINTIVNELTKSGRRVATTALTGCAALLLGPQAKTIHSWAGIGLGKEPASTLIASIRKYNFKAVRRWCLTNTLIIDEISMLTPELLEKLNTIAIAFRRDSKPMGGLQLIFVGDFFQLPPIYETSQSFFAFESPIWSKLELKPIQLTQIVRQTDMQFQTVLNESRLGKLSQASIDTLKTRCLDSWQKLKIRPTLLFSRRMEVEMINERNLRALKGDLKTYEAKTVFDASLESGLMKDSPVIQKAVLKLDRCAPYKVNLELKVGAQVMLIYNIDPTNGLVNGSRGVIEGFTDKSLPLVLFKGTSLAIPIGETTWQSDEVDGLKRSQIPLILAYAVTIHKCQGATLDSALIDIGPSTSEVGQAYVALSRVKSLDSLYIYELDASAFKAHPKVKRFYEETFG